MANLPLFLGTCWDYMKDVEELPIIKIRINFLVDVLDTVGEILLIEGCYGWEGRIKTNYIKGLEATYKVAAADLVKLDTLYKQRCKEQGIVSKKKVTKYGKIINLGISQAN